MADKSSIEWTDSTWNIVTGCSKVSEGCRRCYAERVLPRTKQPFDTVVLHPDRLSTPLKWTKPRRIFVNSLSDLFHEDVTDRFIGKVYETMCQASQHTYQILTKRPKRMLDWISRSAYLVNDPPKNIWLGVSVENQETADERIPLLLQAPAAVRFVSAEPLLGPVNLAGGGKNSNGTARGGFYWLTERPCPVCEIENSLGQSRGSMSHPINCGWRKDQGTQRGGIDWVIVGGESGSGARPMHPDWARSIREQCQKAGVPYFFKQWGEWKPISEMSEEETNSLYVSNRKARPHEDQDNIDDCYGRRCKVESCVIRHDGAVFGITDRGAFELRDGHAAMTMFKVGKKNAGSKLDRLEWKEWPR